MLRRSISRSYKLLDTLVTNGHLRPISTSGDLDSHVSQGTVSLSEVAKESYAKRVFAYPNQRLFETMQQSSKCEIPMSHLKDSKCRSDGLQGTITQPAHVATSAEIWIGGKILGQRDQNHAEDEDCSKDEKVWRADSVRRKRKKKMNKHKHAKRRKLNRHRK